jgi:hypothetical protein
LVERLRGWDWVGAEEGEDGLHRPLFVQYLGGTKADKEGRGTESARSCTVHRRTSVQLSTLNSDTASGIPHLFINHTTPFNPLTEAGRGVGGGGGEDPGGNHMSGPGCASRASAAETSPSPTF